MAAKDQAALLADVRAVPSQVVVYRTVQTWRSGDEDVTFSLFCVRCSGAVYGKLTSQWASKQGAVRVAGEHAAMHAKVDAQGFAGVPFHTRTRVAVDVVNG